MVVAMVLVVAVGAEAVMARWVVEAVVVHLLEVAAVAAAAAVAALGAYRTNSSFGSCIWIAL